MEFTFNFTSTQADLLDALDAVRTARTRMRSFARIGMLGLGLVWLAASLQLLFRRRPGEVPGSLIALAIGMALIWFFGIRPFVAARNLRRGTSATQNLSLRFGEAAVDIDALGVGQFHRPWSDVIGVSSWPKGMLFRFRNGSVHWIPNRVFHSPTEQKAFVEFVKKKISRRNAA